MRLHHLTVDEVTDARRFVAMIRPATILAMALLGFIFVVTMLYHGMVTQGPQEYGTLTGSVVGMAGLLVVLVGVMVLEIICLLPMVKRSIAKSKRK